MFLKIESSEEWIQYNNHASYQIKWGVWESQYEPSQSKAKAVLHKKKSFMSETEKRDKRKKDTHSEET